jgi:hypothetical protein
MSKEQTQEVVTLPAMNIKNCGADPKDAIRIGKQVFMCRIYGEANDSVTKENRKTGDPYSYLVGEFRAVNAKGEQFESEKLYLPNAVQEKVQGLLKTSGGAPVRFGYDFFSTPSETASTGYQYAASVIVKTEATDRLAEMAKEMDAKPLPASTVVPAKEKR